MKNIAFIPARSGSQRLLNKNIKTLGNMPLSCWTINAFLESNCFDKVIFSSDSELYFEIIKKYINNRSLEFHLRNSQEAGNKVKLFDYIKQNIDHFAEQGDTFAIGLPTTPFRNSNHIKDAMKLFQKSSKSIFSAVNYNFPISFAFSLDPNKFNPVKEWNPLFSQENPMITGNTRSQDQTKYFHPNGAIYIFKKEYLKLNIKTFYDNAKPYIMDAKSSIDIDTEDDFLLAEAYLLAEKNYSK